MSEYIDKITDKDTGESRIISPAAEDVRVDNENFEGDNLEDVLDEVAHAIDEAIAQAGGQVTVTTNGDGTFTIHSGDNDYTINLNHTHEGMAKLVVDEAANLPAVSEMESDTIYGEVDDGEISVIYLGGLPFYGGGGSSSGPVLRRPNDSTIDMGSVASGETSVEKSINIKGSRLTQSLTIEIGSGSTGYAFKSTQGTGVTFVSTTELTVTAAAANSVNGVDIVVVYTGSAYNAEGSLGITGESGISADVTLIANVKDLTLIADWHGEDPESNGRWVDRENSIPIILSGTAAKVTEGYQLNNLSSQIAAQAMCDPSANTLLNQKIDKEFTCFVNCLVKFDSTDNRRGLVVDFGGLGDALSGLSLYCIVKQDGTVLGIFKKDGNNSAGPAQTASSGIAFPINAYTEITIKIGARLLQNGKQELFVECGNAVNTLTLDTPVTVGFAGTQEYAGAFELGVYYLKGLDLESINTYFPKYFASVIYKSIQIYNVAK